MGPPNWRTLQRRFFQKKHGIIIEAGSTCDTCGHNDANQGVGSRIRWPSMPIYAIYLLNNQLLPAPHLWTSTSPAVATKKQPHMPSRRAMKSVLGPSKEQALNLGLSATVIFRHYTAWNRSKMFCNAYLNILSLRLEMQYLVCLKRGGIRLPFHFRFPSWISSSGTICIKKRIHTISITEIETIRKNMDTSFCFHLWGLMLLSLLAGCLSFNGLYLKQLPQQAHIKRWMPSKHCCVKVFRIDKNAKDQKITQEHSLQRCCSSKTQRVRDCLGVSFEKHTVPYIIPMCILRISTFRCGCLLHKCMGRYHDFCKEKT